MTPTRIRGGVQPLGWYVSETAANSFPRLPVRDGESVLVTFAMFDDRAAVDAFAASDAFGRHQDWARTLEPRLAECLVSPPEIQRLVPTARSAIHL